MLLCVSLLYKAFTVQYAPFKKLLAGCSLLLCFIPLCRAQIGYEVAFPALSFNFPVELLHAGDGTDRIFVVEQPGLIKVFTNDPAVSNSDTFLDIRDKVRYSPGQEIGLLGLAFHPVYAENGFFYVYYTRDSEVSDVSAEMVLARYSVSDANPDAANSESELILFSFDKNQNDSNHNGGKIAFGPDGYLYISIGDGGGAGDPSGNGQDLNTVFGSILRIDIDLDGSNPLESNPDLPNGNYEIPASNPRVGQNGLNELYAWGIRNTWKFAFDAPTNRLWGADVGQDGFEEINLITNGGNYGWNRFEANSVEDESTTLVTSPDTKPVLFYDHANGDVSITGGYVYRGASNNPSLQGRYIYGDYVSGRVWSLNYNASDNTATSEFLFRTNGQAISSFGLDESGELYFSDYRETSEIYRIVGERTEPVTVPVEGVGNWMPVSAGTNGTIQAVVVSDSGTLYLGGTFTMAGNTPVSNLASFDPVNGWSSFGTGTNGSVHALAIGPDGHVYVGGEFTEINGQAVSNIAFWNGSSWSGMNGGTNGPVAKIGIGGSGEIFVGGAFEFAGGIAVNNVAMWDGASWVALTDPGTGVTGTNNEIRAMAFDENNTLYIGGNFDSAGGKAATRIATWNGSGWGTLGTGTSGFVQAIAITPISVYVGGNFSMAGGNTVNRVARWNRGPQTWEALGQGLSGNVNSLLHDGVFLYVGGNFETASDVPDTNKIMNNVARWNDAEGWQALGPGTLVGVDSQINSMAFSAAENTIYAVGSFSLAGPIDATNIAIWGPDLADADNDGVVDSDDDCPGTPPNGLVDSRGCEISSLPADNFRITVTGTSCVDSGNGRISIATEANSLTYFMQLTGEGINEKYTFSSTLHIDNLPGGEYTLCITADNLPGYENCSKAIITVPETLSVESSIDKASKSITLKMSGSNSYTVKVNGLAITTSESELTLFLQDNITNIEVYTDKECQGSYRKIVLLASTPLVVPNPFDNELNLKFDGDDGANATIAIYDLTGRLVHSSRVQVSGDFVSIDTSRLVKGLYILKIRLGEKEHAFKILKG